MHLCTYKRILGVLYHAQTLISYRTPAVQHGNGFQSLKQTNSELNLVIKPLTNCCCESSVMSFPRYLSVPVLSSTRIRYGGRNVGLESPSF